MNLDVIKAAAKTLQEAGKIELYEKLLDVQQSALELLRQNDDLHRENARLKEERKIAGELAFKNNSYWRGEDGPFCSGCWDKTQALVRMHVMNYPVFAKCPGCMVEAKVFPERERPLNARRGSSFDPFSSI